MTARPTVAVVKVSLSGDARDAVLRAVEEAMNLADWKSFIDHGADVCLKPNLGWDLFLPGAVSAPWAVEGVVRTILGHVGQIFMVESGQILVDVERPFRQTRLLALCREYGIQWVNMSHGAYKRVSYDGLVLKEVELPEILLRTQIITMPVMKTHGRTVITGAVKNQWGCLRELRHNYHLFVNEALADVNGLIRPRFAIMDGTVGLEGNGPKSGKPKIADLILASSDIVAVDSVAARLMGFSPHEIKHLRICAERGVGVCDEGQINVVPEGADRQNLHFQPGQNNTIAVVEMLLRRSFFRRLVFHSPLLGVFCLGAKLWYALWYYLYRGARYRDEILRSRYGPQWL